MREWVKALPLTVALPVVIGASSVKPEDAASNIAAWIEFIGFHNLPHWLTNPHADQHVIAFTCFAAAIYSFAVWGPHRKKRMTTVNTWGPWLFIVGGPALGIVWLYLTTQPVTLAAIPAEHAFLEKTALKPTQPSLDGTIKVERDLAPSAMPPDGKILELIIGSGDERPISYQTHWASSQIFATHPHVLPDSRWETFKLTNFNSSPVFNLSAEVRITYIDAIKIDEHSNQQKQIDQKTIGMSIPQLDAGPASAIEVFVFNLSKFTIIIDLPKEAEIQRLGSSERERVKLIQSPIAIFGMPPKS